MDEPATPSPADDDTADRLRIDWLRRHQRIDDQEAAALAVAPDTIPQAIDRLHAAGTIGSITCHSLKAFTATSQLVGPFVTLKIIGEGAMGRVELARHVERGTLAALKTIRVDKIAIERLQKRFKHEVELLYRIDHPAVAKLYAWDLLAEKPWLAMEYVPGIALDRYIRTHGPLPEALALKIIQQLADGLQSVQEQVGLVHRDIKPANIMLEIGQLDRPLTGDDDPKIKLIDFGLAKDIDAESAVTLDGSAVGTPSYMSDEQIADSATVDHRADIYGLGATCYHMLTGVPPFKGNTPLAVLQERVKCPTPDPSDHRPDIHPQVRDLIRMAMAPDIDKRYQSHKALCGACRLILDDVFHQRQCSRESDGASNTSGESQHLLQTGSPPSGKRALLRRAPGTNEITGQGSSALRQLLVHHGEASASQAGVRRSGSQPGLRLRAGWLPIVALLGSILLLLLALGTG